MKCAIYIFIISVYDILKMRSMLPYNSTRRNELHLSDVAFEPRQFTIEIDRGNIDAPPHPLLVGSEKDTFEWF